MRRPTSFVFLVATLPAQVTLLHLGDVDVSNAVSGIGNNPSAIAFSGTALFVAGFNGTGAIAPVAINKLTDPLGAATWGTPFGVQAAAPSQRGYVNLELAGTGRLAAGYDPGTAVADGLTLWDSAGVQLWQKNGRGSSGVAFDPGAPGGVPALGSGIGWARFGTTGRALQDLATGTDIYDFTTGMLLNVAGQGSNFRDLAFDPAGGDIYARSSNNVLYGQRTGDNTCVMSVFFDAVEADAVNMQNVAVLTLPGGTVVVWNDRAAGFTGQSWFASIMAASPGGASLPIDWGAFAPPTGAGAYDFSFDLPTSTLAISDFLNRRVHFFQVFLGPFYPYGSGCAGQGGFVPMLSAINGLLPGLGGPFSYELTNVAPLSLMVVGLGLGQLAIPLGGGCTLLVDQVQILLGPAVSGPGAPGSGVGSLPVVYPGGFPGLQITAQGVVLENGSVQSLVWTNGINLTLP